LTCQLNCFFEKEVGVYGVTEFMLFQLQGDEGDGLVTLHPFRPPSGTE